GRGVEDVADDVLDGLGLAILEVIDEDAGFGGGIGVKLLDDFLDHRECVRRTGDDDGVGAVVGGRFDGRLLAALILVVPAISATLVTASASVAAALAESA